MTSGLRGELAPARERWLLLTLAAIQFIHIADFMVMAPMGPVLMRTFDVGPAELAWLVSTYTFAAGAAGLLAAPVVDRFDRRRVVLTLFGLFTLATLACGVAPGYWTLLVARAFAGAFGGVLGAMVYTVVGDAVPEARRGAATGLLMSAFSLATIAGVPLGLAFAAWFGWHGPFLFLAAVGVVVFAMAWRTMPSMRTHLRTESARARARSPLAAVFAPLRAVLADPNHLRAFAFVTLLMLSSFTVIPFISAYNVLNVGVAEASLPWIYFAGGAATLVTSQRIGRWADRAGKPRVYRILALASFVPLFALTHLPPVPLWVVLVVNTVFFVIVPARMIPGMAIVTSAAQPALRGAFMSLNSAVQSLASGLGALLAGLIVTRSADGRLEHFDVVGWIAMAFALAGVWWVRRVRVAQTNSVRTPV